MRDICGDSQVERTTAPKPKEEFTGMMGNLARALDERHKVMHSSGKSQDTTAQAIRPYNQRKAKRNLPSFLLPITPRAPLHGASHVNTNGTKRRLKILIIYLGKPEIPVGISNGFWQASENMGCDLRRFNFSTLFSLLN